MEWIATLRGQVVGLDTAPLIYFIEQHASYHQIVRPFFEAVERGELAIVTSVVTLSEVLVHPLRQGNIALAQEYREILLYSRGVNTIELSPEIAEAAASLRATNNFRTPDAIQLATASHAGASSFANFRPQVFTLG